VLAPYRPAFSLQELPEFSKFIGWFSVAQLVGALNWQFDRILLGRFVSKSSLGQYTVANDLAYLPMQSLIGPAMTSVHAALSSVSSDRERLRDGYLKASRLTMMLAAPICLGMSLTSDLIVNILLDAKWTESIVYLKWLALTFVFASYCQPVHSLALAISKPDTIFRLNLINLSCNVPLISLGLYVGSIPAVIAARGAMSLIMFAASAVAVRNLAGIGIRAQIRGLREVAMACAAMTITALLLRSCLSYVQMSSYLELALTGVAGALVYIGVLHLLGIRIIQISGGIIRLRISEAL
jgi:PST family polysaccharide transporter